MLNSFRGIFCFSLTHLFYSLYSSHVWIVEKTAFISPKRLIGMVWKKPGKDHRLVRRTSSNISLNIFIPRITSYKIEQEKAISKGIIRIVR